MNISLIILDFGPRQVFPCVNHFWFSSLFRCLSCYLFIYFLHMGIEVQRKGQLHCLLERWQFWGLKYLHKSILKYSRSVIHKLFDLVRDSGCGNLSFPLLKSSGFFPTHTSPVFGWWRHVRAWTPHAALCLPSRFGLSVTPLERRSQCSQWKWWRFPPGSPTSMYRVLLDSPSFPLCDVAISQWRVLLLFKAQGVNSQVTNHSVTLFIRRGLLQDCLSFDSAQESEVWSELRGHHLSLHIGEMKKRYYGATVSFY